MVETGRCYNGNNIRRTKSPLRGGGVFAGRALSEDITFCRGSRLGTLEDERDVARSTESANCDVVLDIHKVERGTRRKLGGSLLYLFIEMSC